MQFNFFFIIAACLIACCNAQLATNTTTALTECDTNQPLPTDSNAWTCQSGCNCVYTQDKEDSMCGSITVEDGATAEIKCSATKSCKAGCAVSTEGSGSAVMKCIGKNSCYAIGVSGNTDLHCSGEGSCYAAGCRSPAHAECTGQDSCEAAGCS